MYSIIRESGPSGRGCRRRGWGAWGPLGLAGLLAATLSVASVGAADEIDPDTSGRGRRTVAITRGLAGSGCRYCHYCNKPTPLNKCLLHPCRRHEIGRGDVSLEDYRGPEVIILDQLEEAYLPVPFDHQGHAQMAEMIDGCATCHHFTPEGERPPACQTCHDPAAEGTDIHKPGLKGAYHQQCLNCHRDWTDETDCEICHLPKAGAGAEAGGAMIPAKDDLTGRVHPPIPEPSSDFYQGPVGANSECRVVFRHREHVRRFGLTCVECHHERSCTRCHTDNLAGQRPRSLLEHHGPCLRCHKRDMDGANAEARCDRCHWQDGRPMPQAFDHADTGWALSRYHRGKSCRVCHATVPFVKREKECTACHDGWSSDSFDHRITGQLLDENHADVACADCHRGRRFDQPPTCDECHDAEDDGIAFPAKRPGQYVGSAPSKPTAGPASP